ncbi:EAL domain-containing protein [Petrocella sp. FN5]|uniref:EAL domain-containing protein n=1 Tax=Petrocella sp. FN5 TaxID=3032002 RepID=UPI0023D9CFAA|nr:EAL domain-containing protein [Petrocella sp. FN5]MDF1616939.1 EAL domain-containing protein [Petrocella sp. FN5]
MNSKQKYFLGITGAIAIILYLLITLLNQPVVLDLNDAEVQWIKDNNEDVLNFYTDDLTNFDDQKFIQSISNLTDLHLVHSKTDADFVISGRPSTNYFIDQTLLVLSKQSFSYYAKVKSFNHLDELSNKSIGLLSSDAYVFSYDLEANNNEIKIYDDLENLNIALNDGLIDGFFLQSDLPILLLDGQIHAVNNFILKQPLDEVFIAMPSQDTLLHGILQKAILYMERMGDLESILSHDYYTTRNALFKAILDKDERDFISNNSSISIGITPDKPYTIQNDDKLYGSTVGIIKEIERISGLRLNLILGKKDTLTTDYSVHDVTMLTFKHADLEDFYPSLAYLETPYVVTGLPGSPNIDDLYGLRAHTVGLLFDNDLDVELIKTLNEGHILYEANYDDLIQRLFSKNVDYILLPKHVLDYYRLTEGEEALSAMYTLDEMATRHLYISNASPLLISIINKTILVTDIDHINRISLNSIPKKAQKNYYGLILFSVFVVLNLIFFGGYYIRYLINKSENERLTFLFANDQLTYLPNKYGLTSKTDSLIAKGYHGQIYYINIDNFKDINDRLGQQMGDQIILEYAQELLAILDEQLILGRISGASFVLIAYDNASISVEERIHQIKTITEAYCDSKVVLQQFTASIAITKFPDHGNSFEELYKYAEHTMDYIHNFLGIDQFLVFEFDIYNAYIRERELVEDIKRGLQNEEFLLYVQPQLILPQEKVIGGEVLVRWQHPTKGLVFPNDFLLVAERNGLMKELDFFMVKRACTEIKRWQSLYPHLEISVNMTSTTFTDKAMLPALKHILETSGINPTWLTIEITEDMGFENLERANEIFQNLQALQVKIALDDFGKGYSSLAYLDKLTFDILKIDKTFIDNIHLQKKSYEIYKIISQLAEVMDISIVVEGVEQREQVDLLNQTAGTIAQGYYFSRPIDLDAFDQYLIDHR